MALPGWLTSTAANVAQWGANVNQALGDNYGASNLRNTSSAIRDPNVVWTGGLSGIGDGKNNFKSVQAPWQTQQDGNSGDNPNNDTPAVLSASTTAFDPRAAQDEADRQAGISYIDSQSNSLRDMLARSGTYLDQGLAGINDDYNRNQSKLNTDRSRALEQFGMKRDDTMRAKDSAIDKVDTNARVLNNSLRSKIGMAGGSDSSAYKFAAPNAVAREASGERNDVMTDYGVNERNLAFAEKTAEEDFKTALDDLFRQRQDKERGLRQGIMENQQDMDRKLSELAVERNRLAGGGAAGAMAAMRPYDASIADRQNKIDGLFNQFRTPSLTPKEVNVQTPQLRDYMVDRTAINAASQAGSPDQSQYSPYRYLLDRDQDQPVY